MKIQSLSPFIKQNYKINNNFKFKPINYSNQDTISFSGQKVEYEEIRPIRMRAYETQIEAMELQGKSKRVAKDAYEALTVAKSEYIKALNIIKIFKQDPQRQTRKLKNGNELRFKSELKGDTWYLEASEHDLDGKAIRNFSAVNFNPVQMTTAIDGINNYLFSDKDVTIMQGINIASLASGGCEAVYKYTLGKLVSASIDMQALENPQIVSDMYFYDENNNLRIYANNGETSDSYAKCDERYVFDSNGKLLTQFIGFGADTSTGTMNFDESLHFDNGRFIAYAKDSSCDKKADEVVSKDAYYLENGEFVHSNDFHFLMTDLEPIVFEDKA